MGHQEALSLESLASGRQFTQARAPMRSSVLDEPAIALGYATAQRDARGPAEGAHARDVLELARRSVRLARIEFDAARVPHDVADQLRQLTDRHVLAPADGDDGPVRVV